jgi:hypothetical protein
VCPLLGPGLFGLMRLLSSLISRGRGAGRFRKLADRDRFSEDAGRGKPELGRGGKGSSVGLSKNDDVLLACGLGTVVVAFELVEVEVRPNSGISTPSFLNLGNVFDPVTGVGTSRGDAFGESANGGGGRFSGRGGLTSVVQDVLNRSLRDVESERGLVVVIVLVCCVLFGVGVWCKQAYYYIDSDMCIDRGQRTVV